MQRSCGERARRVVAPEGQPEAGPGPGPEGAQGPDGQGADGLDADGRGADGLGGGAALAERRYSRAWAAALGSRRHAELPRPARHRPARRVAACAAVPRVIGLPLQHSPVPSALGFLQHTAAAAGEVAAARHPAGRQAAATGGQP